MPADTVLADSTRDQVALAAFAKVPRPCLVAGVDGRIVLINESASGLLAQQDRPAHASRSTNDPDHLADLFAHDLDELRRDLKIAASNRMIPLRWTTSDAVYNINVTTLTRSRNKAATTLLLTLSAANGLADQFADLTLKVREANRAAAAARTEHAALEAQHEQLQQFAFAMAHDLKAPLRRITLLLGFLEEDHGQEISDEAQDLIHKARESAERLSVLITKLLEYGQITSSDLELEEVAIAMQVNEVLGRCATELDEISATTIVPADLGTIDADPTLLDRMLDNLIGNAIKYRSDARPLILQVTTRLSDDDTTIQSLTITDNGQGIDPERAHLLFLPFKRDHAGSTPGNGIGLAICQTICDLHGWAITATGQPDVTASFTIDFNGSRGTNPTGERPERPSISARRQT